MLKKVLNYIHYPLSTIHYPLLFVLLCTSPAWGQSGSLGGTSSLARPDGKTKKMAETSLLWQSAPRQKVFKEQDLVHVHIKQSWNYNNTANNQRKKSIKTNAKISGWFKWPDLFAMPVKSEASLPEIGGELDHKTQNQGNLTRKETLDFKITCTITSVQDNGNLFVEGTSSENVGEEGKIMYVCGYVRPEDIGPDNTVEGSRLGDIVVKEIPSGNVYDTTRRTWGARLIEQWKPF